MPPNPTATDEEIRQIYLTLGRAWGPQHWWPAQSQFEVIVGAFLTQNTSWSNVELAMQQLRAAKVLSVAGIRKISLQELEKLVRPSGYFRQKAQRLKNFVSFLDEKYRGSLTGMFSQPTEKLREELLSLNGIGPETADSILLYAGQHPVFVIDGYTRRLAARHQIASDSADYEALRSLFERALRVVPTPVERGTFLPEGTAHPPSRMSMAKRDSTAQIFNDMHGFMVGIGKNYCRKAEPDCEHCPLASLLPSPPRQGHRLISPIMT
jgi:endonuclease III related protein